MKYKNRYLYYSILPCCLLLIAIGVYVSGYNPPTQGPPYGNLPAPINASLDEQTKAGNLIIEGDLTIGGLKMEAGAEADKVLTTNASGVASWKTPAAVDTSAAGETGYVQFNNNGVFGASSNLFWDNTNKRFGIGTRDPSGVLDVYIPGVFVKDNITYDMLSAYGLGSWNSVHFVDNNTSTGSFYTDGSGIGSWFKIDSGAGNAKSYTKARVYTSDSVVVIWDIQYSDDNLNWDTAATDFYTSGGEGWKEKTWNSVGAHEYWRFYKTNADSHDHWHMELEMYEDSIGTVFIVSDSGNVGIGTKNPSSLLEVAGTGITLGGVTKTTWPRPIIRAEYFYDHCSGDGCTASVTCPWWGVIGRYCTDHYPYTTGRCQTEESAWIERIHKTPCTYGAKTCSCTEIGDVNAADISVMCVAYDWE